MVHYFESLAYLEVVVERSFVLILERGKDLRVVPVNYCITMFFMGGNARVAPVLQFDRSFVLTASGNNFPFCLADVFFICARTFETIDSILFIWGRPPFVF